MSDEVSLRVTCGIPDSRANLRQATIRTDVVTVLLQNDRVSTVVLVNRRSNVPTEVVIAKKLSGRAIVQQVALSVVVTRLRAINDASIRSNHRRRSGIIIYAT